MYTPAHGDRARHSRERGHAPRADGGTPRVIEEILDAFAIAGATARIVNVHRPTETRAELVKGLQVFADAHPARDADQRRFATERTQDRNEGENP